GSREPGAGSSRPSGEYCSLLPAPFESQTLKHLTVEVVLTLKQAIEPSQEVSRLGPLDDPVIVRRGDRHALGGSDLPDRPGREDRALTLHEAHHRGDRPDGPRVR